MRMKSLVSDADMKPGGIQPRRIATLAMGVLATLLAAQPSDAWQVQTLRRIVIYDYERKCMKDHDCTIVQTSCDFCSCPSAVNQVYATKIGQAYSDMCPSGPTCDPPCANNHTVECKSGQCTILDEPRRP